MNSAHRRSPRSTSGEEAETEEDDRRDRMLDADSESTRTTGIEKGIFLLFILQRERIQGILRRRSGVVLE